MKIDSKYKLESAIDKKGYRTLIADIGIDGDLAIATNGCILAAVPIERGENDKAKRLSVELFLKAAKVKNPDGVVLDDLNGTAKLRDGSTHPNNVNDENFPDWRKIIPTGKAEMTIGINAKFLFELSKAMGCESLRLEIIAPLKTIRAFPLATHDNSPIGLIMPVRVLDTEKTSEFCCDLSNAYTEAAQ